MLDERAKLLLTTLVNHYIAEGQPVGSRTLSRAPGVALSAATIRNVMSDLEMLGLIASPHTSAGRIPTARGYRLFVDMLLTAPSTAHAHDTSPQLIAPGGQPERVIASAAQALSQLSQYVGVVLSPKRSSVFRHIEFVLLGERRVLVIIVSPDGDVQNRVLITDAPYTQDELLHASNYLNTHYSGMDIAQVGLCLKGEVERLRGEITTLMQAAVAASSEALGAQAQHVVLAGESKLLAVSDFSQDMAQLRSAFDLFEQKTQLMRLLEGSQHAQGVHIYIGGESQNLPLDALSLVSAHYRVDGQVVGTLGIIGPTRMPYQRVIDIVDITSRQVSQALSGKDGPA